jgi:hypothetical protein
VVETECIEGGLISKPGQTTGRFAGMKMFSRGRGAEKWWSNIVADVNYMNQLKDVFMSF